MELKYTPLYEMLIVGKVMCRREYSMLGTLYFTLNFVVNLKML